MTGVLQYLGERPRRTAATMSTILLAGVLGGLIAGGAFAGANRGAQAAATPTPPVVAPPEAQSSLAPGAVVADFAADSMTGPIALGRTHTLDGAVSAFTAYASWLVGSPAAAADPWNAPSVVGGKLLNSADAGSLATMQRAPGDHFDAEHGAYRVIAHAGDPASPTEVMLEVTAPLTLHGSTRWRTIGGVVTWTASGWQLVSIQPRDVEQPSTGRADARSFTAQERTRTFTGLGWRSFRPSAGR